MAVYWVNISKRQHHQLSDHFSMVLLNGHILQCTTSIIIIFHRSAFVNQFKSMHLHCLIFCICMLNFVLYLRSKSSLRIAILLAFNTNFTKVYTLLMDPYKSYSYPKFPATNHITNLRIFPLTICNSTAYCCLIIKSNINEFHLGPNCKSY